MKTLVLSIMALLSVSTHAADDESTLLDVGTGKVRLLLEKFRSAADQAKVLTRKDQLLTQHSGDLGMSVKPIMSPVRNQGARGTCTAFAAVAMVEAFTGNDFSEQCLVRQSSDTDGGHTEQRLEHVRQNGLYAEADCPYDDTQRDKIPNLNSAGRTRFDGQFEVVPFGQYDPLAFLKTRLAVKSPVAVAFYVAGKKQWSSGPFLYIPDAVTIAKECGFEQSCAGHAVVVTGMNDTLQLIEFKNSWGKGWGKDGYGYMSYDYFLTFGKGYLVSY